VPSIDRYKQLLSTDSALSDSDLLELREALSAIALFAIDAYLTHRTTQATTHDTRLHAALPEVASPLKHSLLTRSELAQEFRVSCRTVDRWTVLREGPPRIKIGKIVYYRRDAVVEWLARKEEKPISHGKGLGKVQR
jgi:predicted DNA-binding transcriptional regulator AlpA